MGILKDLNVAQQQKSIRGRGAALNPAGRFEKIRIENDPDRDFAKDHSPKTNFSRKPAKSEARLRRPGETQLTFFDGASVFPRSP